MAPRERDRDIRDRERPFEKLVKPEKKDLSLQTVQGRKTQKKSKVSVAKTEVD